MCRRLGRRFLVPLCEPTNQPNKQRREVHIQRTVWEKTGKDPTTTTTTTTTTIAKRVFVCPCMYGCLFRSFNHQLHRPKQRRDHVRQQAVVTATDADRQSNKANKGFRGERGGGQTQLCLGIHSYSIVSYWITKTTMPRA